MRPVGYEDIPWLIEAYADWHTFSGKEPVTAQKVIDSVRRWIHRDDEIAMVEGRCLMTYRAQGDQVVIDNIVTHPDHREQGQARALIAELTAYLIDNGFEQANFKTLPGPMQQKYPDGIVRK